MTDAQTEARAIARKRFDELPEFWQGYIEQMVEDHVAALAAKDEELATAIEERDRYRRLLDLEASDHDKVSAQLAEARKVLEPFAALADAIFHVDGDGREMNAGKPDDANVWAFDKAMLTYGHFRVARRALGRKA